MDTLPDIDIPAALASSMVAVMRDHAADEDGHVGGEDGVDALPFADPGFRKVDPDRWEFHNAGFLRGQKSLLQVIHRRKPVSQSTPAAAHKQLGKACVEVGSFGLTDEVERLKRDRHVLMGQLVELRQNQELTEKKVRQLQQKLHETDERQKQMLLFMIKAMENPAMLAKLMQKSPEPAEARKKRRVPGKAPLGPLSCSSDLVSSPHNQVTLYTGPGGAIPHDPAMAFFQKTMEMVNGHHAGASSEAGHGGANGTFFNPHAGASGMPAKGGLEAGTHMLTGVGAMLPPTGAIPLRMVQQPSPPLQPVSSPPQPPPLKIEYPGTMAATHTIIPPPPPLVHAVPSSMAGLASSSMANGSLLGTVGGSSVPAIDVGMVGATLAGVHHEGNAGGPPARTTMEELQQLLDGHSLGSQDSPENGVGEDGSGESVDPSASTVADEMQWLSDQFGETLMSEPFGDVSAAYGASGAASGDLREESEGTELGGGGRGQCAGGCQAGP
eukprot:jgi/Mesvir1/3902/Mv19848-RA.1